MPPSQPKPTIRNTPLPFIPKSKFRKKLELALRIAKDHIEEGFISEELHAHAQKMRRRCASSLASEAAQKVPHRLWGDAHLLDLIGVIWDPNFLSTISDEETSLHLHKRAKQSMVTAGYISAIEIQGSRHAAFWSESELRQFSNASKLIAQAEILLEFARVREEARFRKP